MKLELLNEVKIRLAQIVVTWLFESGRFCLPSRSIGYLKTSGAHECGALVVLQGRKLHRGGDGAVGQGSW